MSMARPGEPALVALDWGTTALRAWLLDGAGSQLAHARAPLGLMQIVDGDFAGALAAVTEGWPETPVIAAGMVGSARGWIEAPYVDSPAGPAELARSLVRVPGRRLWIVPGIRQRGPAPDVMRGEETEIAGALALRPDLTAGARLVLPGTHSKWVRIAEGRIESFTTYMTGELFAALRAHSILGRGIPAAAEIGSGQAFLDGIDAARDAAGLAPLLFSARARVLDGRLAPEEVPDYLSGLLIGDEIRSAGADRAAPPVLIGEAALCARYARALARFGVEGAETLSGAAVAGLWRIATAAGLVDAAETETA